MNQPLTFKNANTSLYCHQWAETVKFYKIYLQLPIVFANDWFVEFKLTGNAYLSLANAQRATIKSVQGQGITITLQVEDINGTWHYLQQQGLDVGPIKSHPWGAYVFYFFDPEGHRLEIWSKEL
ncbi:MAG: VOC family protein [Chloroflexota bacterium]